ncbi:RlpA-like double-psi beta-barrel-protein domain-containing protein-containing protein [Xylariaceae sp. FL0594]|nr:RlpA-like double-psi beta-barrel-protein domain-containing protein-containing protein [Xylariaceae sp. FL0594]
MLSLSQLVLVLAATTSNILVQGAPTPTPATNEPRGASYDGELTYYAPGLGACGWINADSEAVVAVSPSQYDGACGKTITIRTKDGSKTAHAKVVDKCPGCASGTIDVSSSVFETLADLSVGRTKVSWSFD